MSKDNVIPPTTRDEAIDIQAAAYEARIADLEAKLEQVDEVLVVNWVGPRKDGDYRRALTDLLTQALREHDDPAISEVAAERKRELADLRAQLEAAKKELAELQATFDLRWKADMRAIARWKETTGQELTWPGSTDLCVWLLERLAEAQAQAAMHQEILAWLIDRRSVIDKWLTAGEQFDRLPESTKHFIRGERNLFDSLATSINIDTALAAAPSDWLDQRIKAAKYEGYALAVLKIETVANYHGMEIEAVEGNVEDTVLRYRDAVRQIARREAALECVRLAEAELTTFKEKLSSTDGCKTPQVYSMRGGRCQGIQQVLTKIRKHFNLEDPDANP